MEEKLKPMSNNSFRLMELTFRLVDFFLAPFNSPRRQLTKIPLKQGMTVVDYGCGPGRYTIPLAEIVGPQGQVFAVDIQPLAIDTVRKKALAKSIINIHTVLVDSYHTGLPDSSTDIVLLIDTIQGMKDHDALFKEIYRLLKNDGRLFMDSGHLQIEDVKQMVKDSGFFEIANSDGRNMLLRKK